MRPRAAVTSTWLAGTVLLTAISACAPQPTGTGVATPGVATPGVATYGVERGVQIYAQNCVPCHRENGEGIPRVYPSLHGSAAVLGDPLELAQWVSSQKRPASIPAGRYSTQMPSFGWLKDEDAAALLTYIRANFGNSASPIDATTLVNSQHNQRGS